MLRYYSRVFRSVELNNTFYRFPDSSQIEQWRRATPRGFRFSVKAHRLITHLRRLRNADQAVRTQLERIEGLGDRRGPVLLQVHPALRCDFPRLQDFLQTVRAFAQPSKPPLVFEFRHSSWHTDRVYDALAQGRASLAIMESDEDEPIVEMVGPLVYLRLHRSSYPASAMQRWTRLIREQIDRKKHVYAYFTHEEGAPATRYAAQLQKMVAGA